MTKYYVKWMAHKTGKTGQGSAVWKSKTEASQFAEDSMKRNPGLLITVHKKQRRYR